MTRQAALVGCSGNPAGLWSGELVRDSGTRGAGHRGCREPAAAHALDWGQCQRPCRQAALRTRSRSTCLRATRRGSAALTPRASHERARHVETSSRSELNRCPGGRTARALSVPTKGANPRPAGPIPPGAVTFGKVLVTKVLASRPVPARRWSALADPAERASVPGWLRQRGEREVLAVAPGASGAVLVVLAAAGRADHLPIVAGRGVCRGRPQCSVPAGLCQPDQAAFARRIRRRRSEARSSSFRPPQVPYFSGREIA